MHDEIAPGFHWPSLGPDGIRLKSSGNRILLAGTPPRGTLYAVCEFLERVAGVRLLAPGVVHTPAQRVLEAPPLDLAYTPPFRYREPHFIC